VSAETFLCSESGRDGRRKVAEETPELILKEAVIVGRSAFKPEMSRVRIWAFLPVNQATKFMLSLYDAPHEDGRFPAPKSIRLLTRINSNRARRESNFDDNALYRHKRLRCELRDLEQRRTLEIRRASIRFEPSQLGSSIGWSTAPGLAMATMDHQIGGRRTGELSRCRRRREIAEQVGTGV